MPALRGMSRRQRLRRVEALVTRLERWEVEGRNLLASLIDMSEPDDDLTTECRRLLEHLDT